MKKKIATAVGILGVLLLTGCSGNQHQTKDPSETQKVTEAPAETPEPTPKPSLAPMSESEQSLYGQIEADIHVVADVDYAETVEDIKANIGGYSGQLYQFDGIYKEKDGKQMLCQYDSEDAPHLILKYVSKHLQEGEYLRVTGVVNAGDENDGEEAVLEAVVVERSAGAEQTN